MQQRLFKLVKAVLVLAVVTPTSISSVLAIHPPPGPILPVRPAIVALPPTGPPIVIDLPGSYILGGNVTGVAGKNGIEISASNVTLDLDGHAIIGTSGSLDGITVIGTQQNISIFNGSISGWGEDGVDAADDDRIQFMDLRVSNYGTSGTGVSGGLRTGRFSTVARCVVTPNSVSSFGVEVGSGSVVVQCSVAGTTEGGIVAGDGSTITDCSLSLTVRGGIVAGAGCTIRNCTLGSIMGSGPPGGISVSDSCYVVGNTCVSFRFLAGSGITVLGTGNRIEANNVVTVSSSPGIVVTGTGNLIIKNSVTGPATAFDIAAGNAFGQIIIVAGGGSFISTDPWANFEY